MANEAWRNARHVTWPGLLRKEREEGVVSLYHPAHGTSLDVGEESIHLVEALLEGFQQPITPAELLAEHYDLSDELLVLLVRSGFVVDESELPFLEHGFLRPTQTPVGEPLAWSDLPALAEPGSWLVVGVPVDMAAEGQGGARHGPAEIRKQVSGPLLSGEGDVLDYDFGRRYSALRPRVVDLGDIDPDGARMDHVGARLRKVLGEALQHRMRPLLLGGDHSITHYALLELTRHSERFGIIHFDAHADLGPSRSLSHANVFAAALEAPQVVSILQIGLRMVERISPYARRVPQPKRSLVTAREVATGGALRALESLPRDIPYYLTFDIDCVDGAVARETGTPSLGGLSVQQASELVDYVARNFQLLGADFVEVAGANGAGNAAAAIAANLLTRCVMGDSPFEPLSSDSYVL